MVVLVPLHEMDAQTVASHFLVEVVSHHGLLETIISDRDPRFQGSFWKELMTNLNTHCHLVQPLIFKQIGWLK